MEISLLFRSDQIGIQREGKIGVNNARRIFEPTASTGGYSRDSRRFLRIILGFGVAIGLLLLTLTACGGGGGGGTPAPTSYTLPGGLTLEMVSIPAGTFTMGNSDWEQIQYMNEGPQHTVTLSAFSMSKCLITQAQWQALMGSNPSYFSGDLSRPVEEVSYADITQADGFLDKLNAATSSTRPAGQVFRLPTEAEWEYAARAGTTTRFYWGDDFFYTQIENYCWYSENSRGTTHPVGLKLPNAWGLYDMAGNVWEWCQDWDGRYGSGPQTDPAGPTSGMFRVLRGGSFGVLGNDCRSATRGGGYYPTERYCYFGLRVVLASPRTP